VSKPKLGDMVVVTWQDAWSDNDEKTVEEFEDDCIITTAGWLVRTGDVISVSPEKVRENWHRGTTHVPKGMVSDIRILMEVPDAGS
jgi:hypothetical protein